MPPLPAFPRLYELYLEEEWVLPGEHRPTRAVKRCSPIAETIQRGRVRDHRPRGSKLADTLSLVSGKHTHNATQHTAGIRGLTRVTTVLSSKRFDEASHRLKGLAVHTNVSSQLFTKAMYY